VRREWTPEELIECWTLLDSDRMLLRNKSGASRLGFIILSCRDLVHDVHDES
jgi:hypothetical protein